MLDIIIWIFVAVVVGILFHDGGVTTEKNRIYEQCIKDNNTKTVVDATELCKTLTR